MPHAFRAVAGQHDFAIYVTTTPAQSVSHVLAAQSSIPVRPASAGAHGFGSPAVLAEALKWLSAAVVLLDDELLIQWSNEAARGLLRLSAPSSLPVSGVDAIAEIRLHEPHLRALFDAPASEYSFEVALNRQGSAVKLKATAKPIVAGDVRMLRILLIEAADPHARSHELTEGIKALNQVLGSLPHMLLVLDDDLNVLFTNRGMQGRSAEELQGIHITKLLTEEVHERAMAAMHRTLATGQAEQYGGYVIDAAGRTRHYSVRVDGIHRDGRVIGLTLNAGESTEQVNAERTIATHARMVDSMIEGVAVIDENGIVHLANPAFDALFGHARGALIGRDLRTLVQWPFDDDWRGIAAGESMTIEFEGHRRGGGTFSASGVLSSFDIAGRNHSLLVLQDVSERKELERGVLQAVNREQYRIGNDLHDGLGQELTGIALMLRGLAGRLTSEYPTLLPEIEGITRLVNNAIESTRSLARGLSPVNLERGGLQDALDGMVLNATELYGVKVVFTHRQSSLPPLNAELANHLYRIAQEAVRNAVVHGQARSIRLHLSSARAKVKLSITDDGVGMPANALDAPGMGLKIMCYRARILGGDVTFESVQPSGTRVVCECPLETAGEARVRRLAKRKSRA